MVSHITGRRKQKPGHLLIPRHLQKGCSLGEQRMEQPSTKFWTFKGLLTTASQDQSHLPFSATPPVDTTSHRSVTTSEGRCTRQP